MDENASMDGWYNGLQDEISRKQSEALTARCAAPAALRERIIMALLAREMPCNALAYAPQVEAYILNGAAKPDGKEGERL